MLLACALAWASSCAPSGAAQAPADSATSGAASAASPRERDAESVAASAARLAQMRSGALQFEKIVHDFGRVYDIDDLECSFAFRNVSGQPIVIEDVKASCGCTTPTLSKNTFQPGESDVLKAKWDPKGSGRQSKTLTVRSDALQGGAAILTISADLTPFVKSEPIAARFEDVRIGREHKMRLSLSCPDENWQVQSVRASHSHVQAAIVDERPGGLKDLEVTIMPGAPWGFLTSKVYVEMSGALETGGPPVSHTAELTASATVVGEVRISQPMFSIGKIGPGSFETELILSREDGAPFEVIEARVNPGGPPVGLRVWAEKGTDRGSFVQRLKLAGETGDYLGYLRGTVEFTTDVPGEAPRTLRFGGNVVR